MLPRSSAKPRSGRSAASWALRRTDPVPTRPPVGISSSGRPTSASRGSPRSGRAASTRLGRGVRREVLGRVHGHVGAAVEHRLLDLLHEHAGSAHGVDRDVPAFVAPGGHDHVLRLDAEQLDDPFRLPAGEQRARRARRHPQRRRHRDEPRRVGRIDRLGGVLEAEQCRQRVGVRVALRGAGGFLDAHRRIVQQLVDEPACQRVDGFLRGGIERSEARSEPRRARRRAAPRPGRAATTPAAPPHGPSARAGSGRAPR